MRSDERGGKNDARDGGKDRQKTGNWREARRLREEK